MRARGRGCGVESVSSAGRRTIRMMSINKGGVGWKWRTLCSKRRWSEGGWEWERGVFWRVGNDLGGWFGMNKVVNKHRDSSSCGPELWSKESQGLGNQRSQFQIVNEGESLNALNKGTKYSTLSIVSRKCMGRESYPSRSPWEVRARLLTKGIRANGSVWPFRTNNASLSSFQHCVGSGWKKVGEEKQKDRGRKRAFTKSAEPWAEGQGRDDSQHWALIICLSW